MSGAIIAHGGRRPAIMLSIKRLYEPAQIINGEGAAGNSLSVCLISSRRQPERCQTFLMLSPPVTANRQKKVAPKGRP